MENPKYSLHIGKCIKAQLEQQGKTTVWLAQQLGYHRTTLYKIYEKPSIDTGMLFHISRVMEFNFFALYEKQYEAIVGNGRL